MLDHNFGSFSYLLKDLLLKHEVSEWLHQHPPDLLLHQNEHVPVIDYLMNVKGKQTKAVESLKIAKRVLAVV